MINNDQSTAEQLLHKHLASYEVVPHFSETRVHKIHNLYTDFPVIAESYLSLLDQLKIAKEALEEIAAQDSGVPNSISRSDCMAAVATLALSKLTI